MGGEKERIILETKRLFMRELTPLDWEPLCRILQDPEVMYAYEHAFCEEEVKEWFDRQVDRYRRYGFGLWAVILKETGEMIGQCGLTMQPWGEKEVLEIGYLFQKRYWKQGYAIEGASACKAYAFDCLHAEVVYSIIRENNLPSQRVAKRNGMILQGQEVKHYYGMEMPHLVFGIKRSDYGTAGKDI